jgi:hypothetical protein
VTPLALLLAARLAFGAVVERIRQDVTHARLFGDEHLNLARSRGAFICRQRRDLGAQFGERMVNGIDTLLCLGARYREQLHP